MRKSQKICTFAPVQRNEGLYEASHSLILINNVNMIDNNVIKTAVNEWLAKGDYYLVDVEMTDDDRIVIEIDHADGVWIEEVGRGTWRL